MNNEKFLPIGTVVMLKEGEKTVMISGYLPMPEEEGLDPLYDYIGCLYPEGTVSSDETLVFNHSQIDTVYYTGFRNDEANEFMNTLKELEKEIQTKGIENFKKEMEQEEMEVDSDSEENVEDSFSVEEF